MHPPPRWTDEKDQVGQGWVQGWNVSREHASGHFAIAWIFFWSCLVLACLLSWCALCESLYYIAFQSFYHADRSSVLLILFDLKLPISALLCLHEVKYSGSAQCIFMPGLPCSFPASLPVISEREYLKAVQWGKVCSESIVRRNLKENQKSERLHLNTQLPWVRSRPT